MLFSILAAYGMKKEDCTVSAYGTGLINHTWKITCEGIEYILQKINHDVFHDPGLIDDNINALGDWLRQRFPEYLFIQPLSARNGQTLVREAGKGYFRLYPFVAASHTYDVAKSSGLAFEAARQFGKFTRLLSDFPIRDLHITLPDFHNLSLRCSQFETALVQGNPSRIYEAQELIRAIRQFDFILEKYKRIRNHPGFRLRVTHHDTKISNVLFNSEDKGLCVIDLDTVMPGYFISDFGDMMRTYLSPVSEEEQDFSRITIREDYFKAIVHGYLGEMKEELSPEELAHVVYAGQFMIYMQAIRFLTDHLNNDSYYGARYEGHNLVRAGNQVTLLQRLTEKEALLNSLVLSQGPLV